MASAGQSFMWFLDWLNISQPRDLPDYISDKGADWLAALGGIVVMYIAVTEAFGSARDRHNQAGVQLKLLKDDINGLAKTVSRFLIDNPEPIRDKAAKYLGSDFAQDYDNQFASIDRTALPNIEAIQLVQTARTAASAIQKLVQAAAAGQFLDDFEATARELLRSLNVTSQAVEQQLRRLTARRSWFGQPISRV